MKNYILLTLLAITIIAVSGNNYAYAAGSEFLIDVVHSNSANPNNTYVSKDLNFAGLTDGDVLFFGNIDFITDLGDSPEVRDVYVNWIASEGITLDPFSSTPCTTGVNATQMILPNGNLYVQCYLYHFDPATHGGFSLIWNIDNAVVEPTFSWNYTGTPVNDPILSSSSPSSWNFTCPDCFGTPLVAGDFLQKKTWVPEVNGTTHYAVNAIQNPILNGHGFTTISGIDYSGRFLASQTIDAGGELQIAEGSENVTFNGMINNGDLSIGSVATESVGTTITNGGTLIINQIGNLTLSGGTALTIDDGGSIIVNGTVHVDGLIINNNDGNPGPEGNYTINGYHQLNSVMINNGDVDVICGIWEDNGSVFGNDPIYYPSGTCGESRNITVSSGFEYIIDENDFISIGNYTFTTPDIWNLPENIVANVTGDLIFDDVDPRIYGDIHNFKQILMYNGSIMRVFSDAVITSYCRNLPGNGFIEEDLIDHRPEGGYVIGPGVVNSTNCGPADLLVNIVDTSQLDLSWNANPETPIGTVVEYRIERESPVGGGFTTLVESTGNNSTVYSDTSLLSGTQYNYKIRGLISNGTCDLYCIGEAEMYAWTVPDPPTSPIAVLSSTNPTSVDLGWTAPSGTVTGYIIERENPIGTGWVTREANYTGGETYSETGLELNTTYNYRISTITNPISSLSQEFNVTTGDANIIEIEYLLVAGGGGGGTDGSSGAGGGGGAGGYLAGNYNFTVAAYEITVGQGGNAGGGGCTNVGTQEENYAFNILRHGQNGTASRLAFDGLIAIGGGGGGVGQGWCDVNGWNGGSGGGAVGGNTAGLGTVGQGNDGGSLGSGGRGGGGAGTAGSDIGYTGDGDGIFDSHGSVGGDGLQNDINGTNIYYAGGGGGGGYFQYSNIPPGSLGGGGDGGRGGCETAGTFPNANCLGNAAFGFPYTPPYGDTCCNFAFGSSGTAGTDGLGGGGGGGGRNAGSGSAGGDGVVIFRYSNLSQLVAIGGDITIDGNFTVHTFTSDGFFNVTDIFVPTSVSVVPASSSQLNLSWINPVNGTLNNQIFRSPDGVTGWTSIYNDTPITSYNDTSLLPDEDYFYKIRAKSTDWGINSTITSNYTLLEPPISLVTTTVSTSQINLSWLPPPALNLEVEYLIVGGGGSGGGQWDTIGSGGGGAGGFREGNTTVTSVNYPVIVGDGGPFRESTGSTFDGVNGDDSSALGITAAGGGGGGCGRPGACPNLGDDGGSGGGSSGSNVAGGSGDTPDTTPDQGFDGGDGDIGSAGGGGGASEKGFNGTLHIAGECCGGANYIGGVGGDGKASSIRGTGSVYYAGGGGGGGNAFKDGGLGGLGGGGEGGRAGNGTAGAPNTGGGGGGEGRHGQNFEGGMAGGSGIVVIRYLTNVNVTTTGGIETTDGAYTVHSFISSDSFDVTDLNIFNYKVEQESPIGGGFTIIEANNTGAFYNDIGLDSATQYNYRVSGVSINSGLEGEPSVTAYNWTQPDAPISPSAVPSSTDPVQLNLQWTAPSGTITGYLIERETPIGNGFIVIEANYTGGNFYNDTGLAPSTTYNYRIASITNPIGPYSPPFNATTGDAPGAPTNVTATIVDPDLDPLNILINWNAPIDIGANTVITGYDIIRSVNLGPYASLVNDTAGLTYNDLTVLQGTNYTYSVGAKGDVIDGNFSAPSNTIETAGVSDIPFGLSALPKIHGDSVQLDWLAPIDDGGTAVNGYKIERQDNGGGWGTIVANTTNTDLTYDDSGLSLNTLYEYRISAINKVGVGSPSNINSTEFLVGDLSISTQIFGGQLHVSSSLTNMDRGIPNGTTSLLKLYIDDVGSTTFFPVVEIPKGTGFNFTNLIAYPDAGNYNVHVNLTIANGVPGITQIKSNTVFIALAGDNFDDFSFYENRLFNYTISNMTFIGDTSGYALVVEYREQNGDSVYYSWQNVVANATKQIPVAASSNYYITTYANPTFDFTGDNGNVGTADIPTGYPGTHTGVSLGDPTVFNIGIDALTGESGIFGLPIVFIFIIALASVFTGRSAPMGIIFIAVALGVMTYMGIISFDFDPANQSNIATWAIIILAVIIGVMVGKRWD